MRRLVGEQNRRLQIKLWPDTILRDKMSIFILSNYNPITSHVFATGAIIAKDEVGPVIHR